METHAEECGGGFRTISHGSLGGNSQRLAATVTVPFDLGISPAENVSPEELACRLEELRNTGQAAQFAALKLQPGRIAAFASVARRYNCAIEVSAGEHSIDDLKTLARETGGRFAVALPPGNTRDIEALAANLPG
jgi:hypothetical protein